MQSKIAEALCLRYNPVAVLWTNEKPTGALQFKEGRWGCVVAMLVAAAKGQVAVFDRKTFGCLGGGTGLGFGNQYVNFPGGIEYFLSTGNQEFAKTQEGQKMVRNTPALQHGERYIKNPQLAKKFVDSLPMIDVPTEFIVLKPLQNVTEDEKPKGVVFLVTPDQLSALVVLAHYARGTNYNVVAPFGAGCQTCGIFAYKESESDQPRAIIGLTDISVRNKVDRDILSFTVPYKMYLEMEDNVEGSFLELATWRKVITRNT
ncbi:MAG: DUF169 domain-containing protein [Peptococcaceae bacterium]|nr:DUF169 domain-containing protein [Peptococcaceae bacterium]